MIQQLGGVVKTSITKQVNFIIVADHIFELKGLDLVNPDVDYPELKGKGKDKLQFNNLFEFLIHDEWYICTVSDMNSIIDKIESAISIEWHMVRGLDYTQQQMKNTAEFAFSVTPYLGEEHYKDDEVYRGFEKYPYLIKYLKS